MLFMWLIKWSWIISSRTRLFYFENGLYLEKWHFETNFEILSWIVGDYICLCAYMLLVVIYVHTHICCWWLYMFVCIYVVGGYICLCAYMLLVSIYVNVHICCWWIALTCYWWWIVGVSMYWTMLVWISRIRMKYVLLLSSPKFTHSCC